MIQALFKQLQPYFNKKAYIILTSTIAIVLYLIEPQSLNKELNSPPIKEPTQCILNQVIDGDTIIAKCKEYNYHIRITHIDAPELEQKPWGNKSKQQLELLFNGNKFKLYPYGKDIYNRTLAEVYQNNTNIGLKLVQLGYARTYKKYQPPNTYIKAMDKAKITKSGIWSEQGLQQDPQKYRRYN